jgi:hypothetical protein
MLIGMLPTFCAVRGSGEPIDRPVGSVVGGAAGRVAGRAESSALATDIPTKTTTRTAAAEQAIHPIGHVAEARSFTMNIDLDLSIFPRPPPLVVTRVSNPCKKHRAQERPRQSQITVKLIPRSSHGLETRVTVPWRFSRWRNRRCGAGFQPAAGKQAGSLHHKATST